MKAIHHPWRILVLILLACLPLTGARAAMTGPKKVELVKEEGRWKMLVDGQPFYMNGATVYPVPPQNQTFYNDIVNFGANTVRNHRTYLDSEEFLDNCAKLSLMVHVGLGFRSIRSGYYQKDEAKAIADQEKEILALVEKFKNHPAVLCWSIGNEFDISHSKEPLIPQYESIERIARKIHEIDPNHPVTLAILDSYTEIRRHGLMDICKSLDFLSCNGYIGASGEYDIPKILDAYGWDKPFVSTELGPEGWWLHEQLQERRYTDWNCVIDYTSTEKEAKYDYCMSVIAGDPRCIGVLTFLWGNQTSWRDEVKEWYGLLDINGYTYGAVDIMQKYWTGHAPEAPAPRIESRDDMKMNGRVAADWIHVEPGSKNIGTIRVGNPAHVKLRYHWRIVAEQSSRFDGRFPDGISGLITDNGKKKVHFTAPYTPGAYRLYLHVYDDVNRKAAYASIPFLVEGEHKNLKDLGGRP